MLRLVHTTEPAIVLSSLLGRRRLPSMTVLQNWQLERVTSAASTASAKTTFLSPEIARRFYGQSSVWLRPASAAAVDVPDVALPSNLTFDYKSSFAPKRKKTPLLVAPKDEVLDIDDDKKEGLVKRTAVAVEDQVDYDDEDYDDDDDYQIPECFVHSQNRRAVIPLPDRLRQEVHHGPDGSLSGSIWLNESVFGVEPVRIDLIKQSVDYIRAKIRGRRKAKSKTISEKSGSGRKVRPQKGTGQARAGHSRPAHWKGGAKAHGPKNTVDYGNIKMNAKQKRLAMISMLSQKCLEGNLIIVDHLQLTSHKTKEWSKLLKDSFGIGGKENDSVGSTALILDHYHEPSEGERGDDDQSYHASFHGVPINLWVASSNLHKVKVANQRFANVYDMLKREKLVLTLSALEQMESRWKEV